MKRKNIDEEDEKDESHCIIAAIDIGPRHMGLCMVDGSKKDNDDSYLPYMEHSTLYMSGEGYGYRKFEESNCTEMVKRWIKDRWDTIFSKCEFVVIEKQMESQEPKVDKNGKKIPYKPKFHGRDCIMIEQNLKAMFDCFVALGGLNISLKDQLGGKIQWESLME